MCVHLNVVLTQKGKSELANCQFKQKKYVQLKDLTCTRLCALHVLTNRLL